MFRYISNPNGNRFYANRADYEIDEILLTSQLEEKNSMSNLFTNNFPFRMKSKSKQCEQYSLSTL